jgi:hypothetical protein
MRTVEDIEDELRGAQFGDARLSARLVSLGRSLAGSPGSSLPECIRDDGQLECGYRFLSNRRVTPRRMLDPHHRQTFERIARASEALAVHDTTELEFGGERQGLGPLSSGSRKGFFLHTTLAVAADTSRQPLGVLAERYWVRTGQPAPKRNGRRLNGQASAKRTERESLRWAEQVRHVEALKPTGVSLIHVGDRETDSFEMLQAVHGLRFVLRANHDRRVFADDCALHLKQACERASTRCAIEVHISARKARRQPGTSKTHPARDARVAQVGVRGLSVSIREPYERNGKLLPIHVVHARELEPPPDTEPVEWILYTSEPIDTPAQLRRVIDLYRARWVIEEFFKALKTGCEAQSLQLETYDALCNAVSLLLPIAYKLLLLRSVGRVHPDNPATDVLSNTQIRLLRSETRRPLPESLTVAQAMIAVAALGGYLVTKAKGPPGWITLGRGLQRLALLETGWNAAQQLRALDDP